MISYPIPAIASDTDYPAWWDDADAYYGGDDVEDETDSLDMTVVTRKRDEMNELDIDAETEDFNNSFI